MNAFYYNLIRRKKFKTAHFSIKNGKRCKWVIIMRVSVHQTSRVNVHNGNNNNDNHKSKNYLVFHQFIIYIIELQIIT